jgi:hypothetical protein
MGLLAMAWPLSPVQRLHRINKAQAPMVATAPMENLALKGRAVRMALLARTA